MYTIGQLAKRFNISRSTLLYYDSIDVLKPSKRSKSNYRLYSEEKYERLAKIVSYREAGLPLKDINKIINCDNKGTEVLRQHVEKLNRDIRKIRCQQLMIIKLIEDNGLLKRLGFKRKKKWIKMLKDVSISDELADNLHRKLELDYPEEHQSFLEYLGLTKGEIDKIRGYYNK
ncbi:MerR family transcriptional regulator [Iocasia frigidifontis]|uniref:MerR family transcriptional regulator n=1 Tax=Iocasia fonsfrigidae TaxID=2682810 RepID=A0A8A7KBA4_9FIRM|nr:MerR family transcriptional regulator [Iocasia fonsfrigidae]QTL99076.1 MerR family transcriptional regulator [Iocasia fonsfrigidae]